MTADIEKSISLKKEKLPFLGVRHLQYGFYFAAIVIAYGARTVLNVAIIAMVDEDSVNENVPTYPQWESKKNIMLSSFFWGYIIFQISAGQLSKTYGAKIFLTGSIFVSSIFMLLIPIFGAKFDYIGVIACRIIQGLAQGFIYPSLHTLLSSWTPITKRATIGSFVYAGGPFGNVISMPLTGFISASSVGWPVAFYLYGAVGIAWSVLYFFLGSESPSKAKSISIEEKKFIESGSPPEDMEKIPTPWKSILTSWPFWAILIAHCGQNWGFWTLLTETPSYLEKILKFDIKSDSLLSALPYLVNWLLSFVMSPIADLLIKRDIVSLTVSRKIFNSIGMFIPAFALIGLSLASDPSEVVTIAILTIAVGFNTAVYSGFNVNHIDISPVHAGPLMGITNCISNVFSIIAPLAVDLMSNISGYKETDTELWSIVFLTAAVIYLVTGSVYIFTASGKVQSWNSPHDAVSKDENKPKNTNSEKN